VESEAVKEVVKELTEQPKPISLKDYKKAMGQLFTVRLDTVKACGHKFHPTNEPKTNCDDCWFAYFQVNGQTTQTAEECLAKEGKQTLTKIKGEKFTKRLLWFLCIIAKLKELENNGKSNADVEGCDRTAEIGCEGRQTTDRSSS